MKKRPSGLKYNISNPKKARISLRLRPELLELIKRDNPNISAFVEKRIETYFSS